MKKKKKVNIFPFHLVSKSPWPIITSFSIFMFLFGFILWFHFSSIVFFFIGLFSMVMLSYFWWKDVMKESKLGFHKNMVILKFYMGMMFLLISEVFFFFGFFWGFFHKCWSPNFEVGGIWPPVNFKKMIIDPFSVPLLKTLLLVSSGATITWSHHSLLTKNNTKFLIGLVVTLIFGLIFLGFQMLEYSLSKMGMNSSVYGSCFFLLTGFHGCHVMVGMMFLSICFIRGLYLHFTFNHHVGLELGIWYWHFVDVVWLFLYIFLYWYGYNY